MKLFIALCFSVFVICGCQNSTPESSTKGTADSNLNQPDETPGRGNETSADIQPIGGVGAGPMTPVAGAENVGGGGGGGVGQAAKDKARSVASQPNSSVDQMSND